MNATVLQPHSNEPASNGHGHELNERTSSPPPRARTRTILLIASVVLALFVVFLILGTFYRSRHNHALASAAKAVASTPPSVSVVRPVANGSSNWSLPGNTQAIQDAIIYARVSGYLNKRYADIGDQV